MIKKLIYSIVGVTALTSCADDVVDTSSFLNGVEKTPIEVKALLDASSTPQTRAADMSFASGDEFVVYLRHVTWEGGSNDRVRLTSAQEKLVTFTKGSSAMTAYSGTTITPIGTGVDLGLTSTNTQETADLTASPALYWDDFSIGGEGDATDLRTDKHYLESFYGYCYNGGVPVSGTELNTDEKKVAGVIGWAVQTNQSTEENFTKSDLLWSAEQTPIKYAHVDSEGKKKHGTLVLPFTHAMSKVTVTVNCLDGFDVNEEQNFASAVLKLKGVNTKSTLTAPVAKIEPSAVPADHTDVTMQKLSSTLSSDKKTCTFTAIIAPTLIKADDVNPFITLQGIDGNDYKVFLTDAIIDAKTTGDAPVTKNDAWSKQLVAYNATEITPSTAIDYNSANGGLSMPGVNYHITVNLKKQAVSANATIRKWTTVNAETEGKIDMPNGEDKLWMANDDVPTVGEATIEVHTVDKNRFVADSKFSLFTVKEESTTDEPSERVNDKYQFATICSYVDNADDTYDLWSNTPEIYWPNVTDNYYFRALAKFMGSTGSGPSEVFTTEQVGTYDSDKGLTVSQGTVADGKDIIWATTPRHFGKTSESVDTDYRTYEKNAAIPPRKGGVPLAFQHIMSKVTFNLEDINKAATVDGWDDEEYLTLYNHPLNPRLDLSQAKIQISNLYTEGTITIENGKVSTTGSKASKVFVYGTDDTGFLPAKSNGNETPLGDCITPVAGNPVNLLKDYVMVPQTIDDDAIITITLRNGATYKAQLNLCKIWTGTDAEGNHVYGEPITEWEPGKHYTYTILLSKESISFRVMIKEWEKKEGSGNATLDWD